MQDVDHLGTGPGPRGDQGPPAEDVGQRRLLGGGRHHPRDLRAPGATPPTCAPAGACSTSRAAAATPRWRRRAAGCDVVSLDYVPALLDRAHARAAAEGLAIQTVEGDAEDAALPRRHLRRRRVGGRRDVRARPRARGRRADARLPARRHHRARQLDARTASSASLFATTGAHVPPPAGLRPPPLWGNEEHVRALIGDGVTDMWTTRRTYTFRFRSPEHFVDFFRTHYGPTLKAFAALDADGRRRPRARPRDARAPLRPARRGRPGRHPGRVPRGRRHPGLSPSRYARSSRSTALHPRARARMTAPPSLS